MRRRIVLNAFLFLLLLMLLGANLFLRPDPARPNLEFLPQMVHSPRYAAFDANPNFADGTTLQTPPAGVIARGQMPLPYGPSQLEAIRAGRELASPFPLDTPRAVGRGAVAYANFCQTCHGAGGTGDGPVARRGFPPPPSLLTGLAKTMKDGQMFHTITFGKNNMAPYGAQLSRDDRWNIVAYVRFLQARAATPVVPTPAAPQPVASKVPALSAGGGQP
jgi:mono/diheme cytochrome c family protein